MAVSEAASMRLGKPMTDREETGTRSVVFAFFASFLNVYY